MYIMNLLTPYKNVSLILNNPWIPVLDKPLLAYLDPSPATSLIRMQLEIISQTHTTWNPTMPNFCLKCSSITQGQEWKNAQKLLKALTIKPENPTLN